MRVYYLSVSGREHQAVITTTHTVASMANLKPGQLRTGVKCLLDALGLELLSLQIETITPVPL